MGFFLPPDARILMLGSFPPPKERWSMNFYYPNFINDMWRIMGMVFFGDKDYFILRERRAFDEEKIRAFCLSKGIALGDTAVEIIRLNDNASDKFLEVVKPIELEKILAQISLCHTIVITGQKAMDTFLSVTDIREPKIGSSSELDFAGRKIKVCRMPSSSRAYPVKLEEKVAIYRSMFAKAEMKLA